MPTSTRSRRRRSLLLRCQGAVQCTALLQWGTRWDNRQMALDKLPTSRFVAKVPCSTRNFLYMNPILSTAPLKSPSRAPLSFALLLAPPLLLSTLDYLTKTETIRSKVFCDILTHVVGFAFGLMLVEHMNERLNLCWLSIWTRGWRPDGVRLSDSANGIGTQTWNPSLWQL